MEMAVEENPSRKYKVEFEKEFLWVTQDPTGKELAFCTTCEVSITPTVACLRTHSTSWRHQKNNYDVKTTGQKAPSKTTEPGRGSLWKKDYELSRKFKDEWLVQFPWVKKKNERLGHCPYCVIDLEPRARRLEDHQNTSKHQKNFTKGIAMSNQRKISLEGYKNKPSKPESFDKIIDYSESTEGLPNLPDGASQPSSDDKRKSSRDRKKKLMFDEIEFRDSRRKKRLKKAAEAFKTEDVSDDIQAKPNAWSDEFPWVILDEEEEKFPYCPFCGEFVEPTVSSLRRHQELVKHRKKARVQILMDASEKDPEVIEQTEVTEIGNGDSSEIHTTVVVPAGTVIQSSIDGMNQASFFPISGTNDQYLQIIIQNETSNDGQNVTELGNSIQVSGTLGTGSEENIELPDSIQITTYDGRTEEIFENDIIEYVSTEDNNSKPFKKRKGQHGRGVRVLKPVMVLQEESEEDRLPEIEPIEEEEGPPKKRFTRRSIRLRKPTVWRDDDDDDDDSVDGKFLPEWLEEYPWVLKKTENGRDVAYCTFCTKNIPAKAVRLRLHDETPMHKRNALETATALKSKPSEEKFLAPKAIDKIPLNGKVEARPKYECDLCNKRFVAQRSLYFHMKEHYEPEASIGVHEDTSTIEHVEEINDEEVETDPPESITPSEYNPKWAKIFPWLTKAEDNTWAFCTLCSVPMEPRLHVIKAHTRHRRHLRNVSEQPNPSFFEMKPDVEGILAAEEQRLSRRKKTPTASLGETVIDEDGKVKTRCPTCKKLLVKTSFAVHWRIHEGVRPYQCTHCDWAFKQAYDLKHHVESIHHGARPHQCEECGKEFTRKYTLRLHQKGHSGNRSHKCDVCQKAFITKSKLVEHYRTHTGERPFLCDYCGRSFRIKFDMVSHKQKAHLGIEVPKRRNPRPLPSAVSEVVVEESLALETHYVQLKDGEDGPLDLNVHDSIVVVGDNQEVHGFDAFEEVIEEEEEEVKGNRLVYINEDECFLSESA